MRHDGEQRMTECGGQTNSPSSVICHLSSVFVSLCPEWLAGQPAGHVRVCAKGFGAPPFCVRLRSGPPHGRLPRRPTGPEPPAKLATFTAVQSEQRAVL